MCFNNSVSSRNIVIGEMRGKGAGERPPSSQHVLRRRVASRRSLHYCGLHSKENKGIMYPSQQMHRKFYTQMARRLLPFAISLFLA